MSYDIDAATAAGHTVDQQLEFLAKLHNYDTKAAEKAGFGKQEQLQYLAGLPEPKSKAENYEARASADEGLGIPESAVGAALGSTLGAAVGPAVGSAVDTAANIGAKVVNPQAAGAAGMPEGNSPAAVRKWLATQTSNPEAGGRTMGEAYHKSELAAGKPVQSRGSEIPIRKGRLGISNQLPEATLPQKAAANIINAEKLGKPGVARRMAGMGVAGAEIGNMIEEAKQGHYGHAALSGLGALGGAATQSRIKPVRAIGTGLSIAVPAIQKFVTPDEEEVQKKAAGGNVAKKLFAPVATKIVKASEALGPHEGKWLNVTQSDRMRSTGGDLGGPGFSKFQLERPEYAEAQAAWGVGKKGTATGITNVNQRFPEGQAIWTPMIGGETQHHSNQHVYDALTEEFNRQARLGNLPKELQAEINKRLATAKETQGMFPGHFDVGNPEHLAEFGNTFDRRGALSTVMSGKGVGGTKGRIIDYPGIMQEMTDPMTVGAPTHSLGTRLFSLNNEIEHRPDLHSAFPYILKGQDQGVAFAPVPKELGIQDFIQQFKEFKGREPGYYDLTRTTPSQQITEKYLRSLEAAGHAAGGKIVKAASDLILPAAENAARTQVSNTVPTYVKAAHELAKHNVQGNIGDFGAGKGLGAPAMAKVLGRDVTTYEPYPQNWKPDFTNAADIPDKYFGGLANLNVLNVLPREIRDQAVLDIGRTLDKGGTGIITTRGRDLAKNVKSGIEGPEPYSVITGIDTYQKGFNSQELQDYLKYMLGQGYDINKLNLGPAGALIKKK